MLISLRAERYGENANVCYLIDFIQVRQANNTNRDFNMKTINKYLPKSMQEKYKIITENNGLYQDILIYFYVFPQMWKSWHFF